MKWVTPSAATGTTRGGCAQALPMLAILLKNGRFDQIRPAFSFLWAVCTGITPQIFRR